MMLYYNTVCCITNTRKYIIRKHNEKRFLLLRGSCGNWLQLIGLWFVRIRERLVGLLGNHLFACPNHVLSPKNERQLSTGLGLITQANKYNRGRQIISSTKHSAQVLDIQFNYVKLNTSSKHFQTFNIKPFVGISRKHATHCRPTCDMYTKLNICI